MALSAVVALVDCSLHLVYHDVVVVEGMDDADVESHSAVDEAGDMDHASESLGIVSNGS